MRAFMITGPSSNVGKTTISLALARAIKNRGYDISGFKTCPDFIDLIYLELKKKKRAGNLDFHLMGKEGAYKSLSMNRGQYGLVEGAMGYFDGIYNTFENSSYHISKDLNIPAILVYSPKGEMFSAVPKIKGMVDFEGSRIKGLILNKTSEPIYIRHKEIIEEYVGIEVLGYLTKDESIRLDSKYLGLALPEESKEVEDFIESAGNMVEKTVNITRILELANEIKIQKKEKYKKRNIRLAIAYDEAFNFYYNENLRILEETCQVTYFSPLWDDKLPQVDLLYMGGGYPELYIDQLEKNIKMKESIKKHGESGKYILAEGGGLMYLMSSIEDKIMVGIFKGHARMTPRLQNFGYVNVCLSQDSILGKKGHRLRGHEFHRSLVETKEMPIFNINKPKNPSKNWQCGYQYKNVLAYYQHFHFLGNMESLDYLFDRIEKAKEEGNVY